jgi:hypothetical protein
MGRVRGAALHLSYGNGVEKLQQTDPVTSVCLSTYESLSEQLSWGNFRMLGLLTPTASSSVGYR